MFLSSAMRVVKKAVIDAANKATVKVMDWVVPVDTVSDSKPKPETLDVKDMLTEKFECVDNYPKKLETGEYVDSTGTSVLSPKMTDEEARAILEEQILIHRARNMGVVTSNNLDKKLFIITTDENIQEGTEKDFVKSVVGADGEANASSVYLDITPSIRTWAAMVQKAAGSKLVTWSPDSIMNKLTFTEKKKGDGATMNERVLIEVDKARVFEEKNFLPEGFKELKGDVSSINVRDLMNPTQTVATEENDDMDALTIRDPAELLEAAHKASKVFAKTRKNKNISYADALTTSLEEANLKGKGEILTEDEVRSTIPEDLEMARKRAQMIKSFTDDVKKVEDELKAERQRFDDASRQKERPDIKFADACPVGCKCGMDRQCPAWKSSKD